MFFFSHFEQKITTMQFVVLGENVLSMWSQGVVLLVADVINITGVIWTTFCSI